MTMLLQKGERHMVRWEPVKSLGADVFRCKRSPRSTGVSPVTPLCLQNGHHARNGEMGGTPMLRKDGFSCEQGEPLPCVQLIEDAKMLPPHGRPWQVAPRPALFARLY